MAADEAGEEAVAASLVDDFEQEGIPAGFQVHAHAAAIIIAVATPRNTAAVTKADTARELSIKANLPIIRRSGDNGFKFQNSNYKTQIK